MILTLHAEGRIAHRTLRALKNSIDYCEERGNTVEIIAVMDDVSDRILQETIQKWTPIFNGKMSVYEVNFRALSLSRNYGISQAKGQHISILDGDDLYGETWLYKAHELCSCNPVSIAHPEFYFAFPIDPFFKVSNDGETAVINLLFYNQWTALVMAHKDIFIKIPYVKDDDHFAFQDWLWNCETTARGYRHVLVPETVMAIRQAPPGHSLWQRSYALNKVVRPNILHRKIFLMEFARDLNDDVRKQHYKKRNKSLTRLRKKLSDYMYTNHQLLYQALDTLLLVLINKLKTMKNLRAIPDWLHTDLIKLYKIEPLLRDFENAQVKGPGPNRYRLARVINNSMAALVSTEKSQIYIVENSNNNFAILNALYYMHALEKPVFVIITGKCKIPFFNRLPQNIIHIDIGNTDLIYKERLQLMHRLLLESDPAFIHVFNSRLALEMFDRYSGTFTGKKVMASFFCPLEAEKSDMIGWELSQYSHLLDFFTRISTDLTDFRRHLLDVFGLPNSFIDHHRIPFAPWLFPVIMDCEDRSDSLKPRSLLPQGVLRILCLGKLKDCDHSRRIIKGVKTLKREGIPIKFDVWDFDQNGLLGLFTRPYFSNKYHEKKKNFGGSKSISFAAYDVILILPTHQGHSSLLIQAMGNGIPIMAQNRPKIREIVDEETGWLLKKDSEPEDSIKILRELCKNPDIIYQKSKAAKKFIEENHSWEGFKHEVARFYNN